ncbi:MAG: 16S rRNA (cytidine(1402)-2'-O)-methyltransferase, partial [Oscillospiraceae bacterium]|nr:16S rRNA (cytidine(1402)-2'-O)-methyltransferase [Oscillospiraceae bacterium]
MAGTLYLVATPIGNLGDFSPRAVQTLQSVDFIAAEDTRVSLRLLNHFEIKKPLVSYHEHNQAAAGEGILRRLLAGESCALVTDAGTPAISDPGEGLVRLCAESGVEVLSIPGCCAAVNALAVSGLSTQRFTFEGFLSTNRTQRREHLRSLLGERRTMIFHEAPHKLRATLDDLYEAFGDRRVSLSREMTKLHEQTLRTTLRGAIEYFAENPPRGEFVLCLEGAPQVEEAALTVEEGVSLVLRRREEGMRMKDAVRQVATDTGLNRNELYS